MEKENELENFQDNSILGCGEGIDKNKAGAGDECLLDVFTPQTLLARFQSMEDCTKDMIGLIKTVQASHSKMRKLRGIFCELSNCNTDDIVELTRSRNRMLRHISTYLVLSKIKQWIEEGRGFSVVEKMYDEVFLVRFRDVDPSIRSLCVESMCEWIIAVPEIFNAPSYLKYVGWSFSDKGDNVRKRGVQCTIGLIQKKVALSTFISRFRGRIIELSLHDKNASVREDGRKLCLLSFLNGFMDKSDAYRVLKAMGEKSRADERGRLIEDVVSKMLSEDYVEEKDMGLLGNHRALHELLTNTSPTICSYVPVDSCMVMAFMQFIAEFLRNESSCCGRESLCYLRILRELARAITSIDSFNEILEIVKDNRYNIMEALECLISVDVELYRGSPGTTIQLLSKLRTLCHEQQCEDLFELFMKLLKKLEPDFSPAVTEIVGFFKASRTFMHSLIKSFDVSEAVGGEESNEVKCYAALWRILRRDYSFINECEFRGKPSTEICDFLIFVKEKCVELGVHNEGHDIVADELSCFKVLYKKLFMYVETHCSALFTDEKSAIMLYRLIENKLMEEHSHLLYELCSEGLVGELYSRSKNRATLMAGFFRYLMRCDFDGKMTRMARLLSAKKLLDGRKVVFNGVRDLVGQKKTQLYDTVLVYFVSHMSANECIIVERMVDRSKFKASLLRKCKGRDVFRSSPMNSSTDVTLIE
jgi:cohesin complex subunit SA-1/2